MDRNNHSLVWAVVSGSLYNLRESMSTSSNVSMDVLYTTADVSKGTQSFHKMNLRRKLFIIAVLLCLTVIYMSANTTQECKQLISDRMPLESTRRVDVIPPIYLVTPTYKRLQQKSDLTRMMNTLRLVRNLHWILIEDSDIKTALVSNLLNISSISYTHLNVFTPEYLRMQKGESRTQRPRGLVQRNAGLSWIRQNVWTPGVVYFADDDNTYDTRLFEEMRNTQNVSVWPVGFIGGLKYATPLCKDGKVLGWDVVYAPDRTFATDMAGFAVNVQIIRNKPTAYFRNRPGLMETDFISQLGLQLSDLEAKANNCTQVLVWHTRQEDPPLFNEPILQKWHGGNISSALEV